MRTLGLVILTLSLLTGALLSGERSADSAVTSGLLRIDDPPKSLDPSEDCMLKAADCEGHCTDVYATCTKKCGDGISGATIVCDTACGQQLKDCADVCVKPCNPTTDGK